jgi:hypothetical protein
MPDQANGKPKHDRDVYVKNRSAFPLAELLKFGDQWLAWSADGTRIVAHHEDLLVVAERVKTAGIEPEDVTLEYIPPEGEVQSVV